MARIKFSGPLSVRLSSLFTLNGIGLATYVRHLFGSQLEPSWDANFETGVRFWRRQFTRAMRQSDLKKGRQILDSLQTETDDVYEVSREAVEEPKGHWYVPGTLSSKAVILYLHGGGYTFHAASSRRFAAMLAHRCGVQIFAPDYRLTPEHPHPAQAEDALAAWQYLLKRIAPDRIVVIGDSAGGHMALMLLQTLKTLGLHQPALCIGLCPWTDIGDRGASLRGNDPYDLVQGWMALQFGNWLDPEQRYGRAALSPISHDYKDLAPIYLQAGGREILHDMICDFAKKQKERGADVALDVWPDMPHDFQAFDTLKPSSTQAVGRICTVIASHVDR
jgi:monoterpene epsilon-lactone hydrolase